MEKISFEMLISTLLNLGFDKVDPILFTYMLGKLSIEDKNHQFVYKQQNPSIGFNKFVDCSGSVIKIKDGYTLDTNVSLNNTMSISFRKTLFSNEKLLSYLESFDFSEIVLKKADTYGIYNPDDDSSEFFSDREIDMLKTLQVAQKPKIRIHNY